MRSVALVVSSLLVVACSSSGETSTPSPSAEAADAPPPAVEGEPDAGPAFGETKRPAAPSCPATEGDEHLEDHACFHVTGGPFGDLTASTPESAPALAKAHTAYTVKVGSRERRWVSFKSKATSTYAFLLGGEAEVDTFSPDGAVVQPVCEGATTGICAGLVRKVHARVQKDATLLLGLTPAKGGEVLVLVEAAE